MDEHATTNDLCLLKKIEIMEWEAQKFGFYWENFEQLIAQIQSECMESQEAWDKGDLEHLQEEIGDLIQATISLAVYCKLDPRATLLKSIEKFQQRYKNLVKTACEEGYANLQDQPMEVLMSYWIRAKHEIAQQRLKNDSI